MSKLFKIEIVKFGIVGGLNTLIDYVAFVTFHYALDIPLILANGGAFLAAMTCSFILHKGWTFKNKDKASLKQFSLFFTGASSGFVINTVFLYILSDHMPAYFAKIGAIGASALWTFLFYKFIVFKKDQPI